MPYGAQTEAEGRALVHTLQDKKVEMIKIWVDDRLKTVPKLQVNVYEAIINEAHKNGMRVVAHIFELEDGKQLLKSGVDGFAHGVRDKDVDAEYMTILKQHPKTWEGPEPAAAHTAGRKRRPRSTWLTDTFPPSQIKRMRDELANRRARPRRTRPRRGTSDMFDIQCRNLKNVHDAGMIIGLGTDANGDIGWGVHTELADMVHCGLTPAEAIVAGTRTSAEILKLDDLGTVRRGKSADFVVLDANPLDNILNTRKISKVYQRGTDDRSRRVEPRLHDGGTELERSSVIRSPLVVGADLGRPLGSQRSAALQGCPAAVGRPKSLRYERLLSTPFGG